MDCSTSDFPVNHQTQSLLKLMSIKLVMPSNHLFLCCPLLLLPSIFPTIRVFSTESALCIRWPKYWSFGFSISSSSEYSGLISFPSISLVHSFTDKESETQRERERERENDWSIIPVVLWLAEPGSGVCSVLQARSFHIPSTYRSRSRRNFICK